LKIDVVESSVCDFGRQSFSAKENILTLIPFAHNGTIAPMTATVHTMARKTDYQASTTPVRRSVQGKHISYRDTLKGRLGSSRWKVDNRLPRSKQVMQSPRIRSEQASRRSGTRNHWRLSPAHASIQLCNPVANIDSTPAVTKQCGCAHWLPSSHLQHEHLPLRGTVASLHGLGSIQPSRAGHVRSTVGRYSLRTSLSIWLESADNCDPSPMMHGRYSDPSRETTSTTDVPRSWENWLQ